MIHLYSIIQDTSSYLHVDLVLMTDFQVLIREKKSLLAIAHASAHRVYLLYPPLKGTYTGCLEKCIEFISPLTHHLS